MLGSTTAVVGDGVRQWSGGLDDLWPVDDRPHRRWRATDARIVQGGAVVVLLLLLTALVGVLSIAPAVALGRQAARDASRMSATARDMYLALAEADAFANAYFLLPAKSSQRAGYLDKYRTATARVDRALAVAVAYIGGDGRRLADVQLVATRLQNYRAVFDEANSLATGGTTPGTVVAMAYARDASDYLRDKLLSAVGRLWTNETARLDQARSRGLAWLAVSVLLPVLDLAALVVLQRWLRRRTRRRLNIGLLVSTIAAAVVLVLMCWSWSHWPAANGQLARVERAVQQEIRTQQLIERSLEARAQEYLEVGVNPGPGEHDERFRDAARCGKPDSIDVQVCRTYQDLLNALNEGDQDRRRSAFDSVLTGGSAATAFDGLQKRLTDTIDDQATQTDQALGAMPPAPPAMGWWVAVLALVGALGAVGGLRPRFSEYR